MEQFPPNSKAAKAGASSPKKIERVASASAVRRRKPLGRRFHETFVQGDGRSVMAKVTQNVVIPAVRDMIFETGQSFLENMIFGEGRSSRRGAPPAGYGNIAYNRPQTAAGRTVLPNRTSNAARARGSFDEIVIDTMQGGEEVIDRMNDVISQWEVVTVADLYTLTGFKAEHTDSKWGWTDLRGASVSRTRTGGYLLNLPQPKALD